MDWTGWATFGFVATVALTAIMVASQSVGLSRMDVPLMLGTIFTADPDRARVAGLLVHLVNGQVFALMYVAAFAHLQMATWWLGLLFGLAHGVFALALIVPVLPGVHPRMESSRAGLHLPASLEPPGAFSLNYGRETPVVTLIAHAAYGLILGALITPH
jgi:hypothetical protein